MTLTPSCTHSRTHSIEWICSGGSRFPTTPPAVHQFEDKQSEYAIVSCGSITSDARDAVRSRLLLPMWANSVSVRIEVNVIDDRARFSLDLTNMRVSC